jgi:hypothetical protein
MEFLSHGIGDLVLEKLSTDVEARIAVAFFSLSSETLAALMRLKKLTLIISEEFTIANVISRAVIRTHRAKPAYRALVPLHLLRTEAYSHSGWALEQNAI